MTTKTHNPHPLNQPQPPSSSDAFSNLFIFIRFRNSDARWLSSSILIRARAWGWEHSFLINNSQPSSSSRTALSMAKVFPRICRGFSDVKSIGVELEEARARNMKTNYSSLGRWNSTPYFVPIRYSLRQPQPIQRTHNISNFQIPLRHIKEHKDINLSIWCRNIFHPPFWIGNPPPPRVTQKKPASTSRVHFAQRRSITGNLFELSH